MNNAIDVSKFKYNPEIRAQKRSELEIADDTLVIGHIGRFVQQKNHHYVVEVFNEVHKMNQNSILVLIGQGPLQVEIENKVKELGLVDSVKFLGQRVEVFNEVHKMNQNSILVLIGQGPLQVEIENKVKELGLVDSVKFLGQRGDVHEWYQAFDVFLFPSIYEGLGMVAIEAQCAGCYCLASTEVPSVAKVTNNIEFLDLNQNPQEWCEYIKFNLALTKRNGVFKELIDGGYNIEAEVSNLEQKYCSIQK